MDIFQTWDKLDKLVSAHPELGSEFVRHQCALYLTGRDKDETSISPAFMYSSSDGRMVRYHEDTYQESGWSFTVFYPKNITKFTADQASKDDIPEITKNLVVLNNIINTLADQIIDALKETFSASPRSSAITQAIWQYNSYSDNHYIGVIDIPYSRGGINTNLELKINDQIFYRPEFQISQILKAIRESSLATRCHGLTERVLSIPKTPFNRKADAALGLVEHEPAVDRAILSVVNTQK